MKAPPSVGNATVFIYALLSATFLSVGLAMVVNGTVVVGALFMLLGAVFGLGAFVFLRAVRRARSNIAVSQASLANRQG